MSTNQQVPRDNRNRYDSDFAAGPKSSRKLDSSPSGVGQSCPQDYPHRHGSLLGEALGIYETAQLLGCSPWTVRHKYLPQGLPHIRASSAGKIVFFRGQVIEWILKRQQHLKKGGMR